MNNSAKMNLAMALTTGLAMALSACGSPSADQATSVGDKAGVGQATATTASTANGKPAAFTPCAACHSTEQGTMLVGPSLFGVVGRKAGVEAGFSYSAALKNSGLTWDEATLDTFLADPMKQVPGTRMTFPGLSDAAQRKAVIDYLETLK